MEVFKYSVNYPLLHHYHYINQNRLSCLYLLRLSRTIQDWLIDLFSKDLISNYFTSLWSLCMYQNVIEVMDRCQLDSKSWYIFSNPLSYSYLNLDIFISVLKSGGALFHSIAPLNTKHRPEICIRYIWNLTKMCLIILCKMQEFFEVKVTN